MTAAVATTMAVFMPLMFMTGIFGKFVRYLPMGVLSGLVFSLLECFFILPHHIGFLLQKLPRGFRLGGEKAPSPEAVDDNPKPRRRKIYEITDDFWQNYALRLYERSLKGVLRLRYLVVGLAFSLFLGTIALAVKGMDFVLFPPEGVEVFMIRAEAPVGTPLEATEKLVQPIEDEVARLPKEELDVFITKTGVHQNDIQDPNTKRATNFAQIVVYLTPEPQRDRIAKEIIEDLRQKVGSPPGLIKVSFDRLNPGPPSGKPISIGVRAKSYKDILPAVDTLKEFLSGIEGVTDLTDSHVLGKRELRVVVDQAEAIAANLTVADIGTTVRAAFEGIEATQIKKLDEEVAVRVTWPEEIKDNTTAVENIRITNRMGNLIPITSVASFGEAQGVASYDHEANERQVRVLGDIDTTVTSSLNVNNQVREKLTEFKNKHPNVQFSFGGEDFDTQESLESLVKTFAIALLGIFLILVVTFQSMSQALLVLFLTVPLGIIAVIWTFFLHGWPITFMGCLGIIALSGVIVNNTIVFTSFVNNARKRGESNRDSLIEAGRLRLRPIFLTTFTTVAGILPTAYGIGGLDKFVVPIALALGWGMFFGSVLTTIVFPASLAILDDINGLLARAFKKVTGSL